MSGYYFSVMHSCGDCGFLSRDLDDFERHSDRKWHRLVMELGLDEAVAQYEGPMSRPSRRASSDRGVTG